MKTPARLCAVATLSTLLLLGSAGQALAADDYDADPFWTGQRPSYTEQTLAQGGDGVFPNYRIPALAVTNAGTVLASYDGRPTAWDAPGPNFILQRRSTDNGATWGEQETIRAGKTTQPIEGYSDPSYVIDRETGSIFNFHVQSFDAGFGGSRPGVDPNDRRVLHAEVSRSDDDGLTWTHRTITADITPDVPNTLSRFAASGQGIQLKYGPHAGRLLQQFTIIDDPWVFRAVTIYSDDHGETWQSGTPVGTGMDENKVVELSDGRVMLNSRDSGNSGFRKVAYSTDGGITYGPVTLDRELPDPTNNASIIRAFPNAPQGSKEAKVLLFSNANSNSSRSNGTVRASCDDGETWPIQKVFAPGAMAYSTLATLPDGRVGLLYEPGHNGIIFAKFNLAWLQGLCAPITAPDLTIERGTSASGTVSVTNQLGPVVKGATLAFDAPEGWTVTHDPAPSRLQPGRSFETDVTVTVPESATGGTYRIPVTFTDGAGRHSTGYLTVVVPRTADEKDGRISVTGGTLTNPKTTPYEVGDVLRFSYRITNLTKAVTTVVPTGNLANLDPANSRPNCRWTNLPGEGAYTCSTPNHTVTQADLDAGEFTPRTTWVSTSGSDVTTVVVDGPVVKLV